jgi:thiamine-monophosphate kinase
VGARIGDFGEKQFIHEVIGPLASTAREDEFDDCVVVDLAEITGAPDAPYLVYSMDQPSFVAQPDPRIDPYRFYGRWIAGTTCNDVIAMGALCKGFSLALAAPIETEVRDIAEMMGGISDVLDRIGARYEGGNLDNGALATVGYAWGLVPRHGIVRRDGAQVGDRIAVTGELGMGWLEYQLRKHSLLEQVGEDLQAMFAYKAMPVGAAAPIAAAAANAWLTSGMDLSDGIVEFLYTVARRSGLGCVVDAEALPVGPVARRHVHLFPQIEPVVAKVLEARPELLALDPGYDSPLRHAFTIPERHVAAAVELFAAHGANLYVVGYVTAEPGVRLRTGDREREIPPFWDDQLRRESLLTAWAEFLRCCA